MSSPKPIYFFVIKSLTWRLLGTLTTALLVYALTKDKTLVIAVAALELIFKILLYVAHEKIWDSGLKRSHQDDTIPVAWRSLSLDDLNYIDQSPPRNEIRPS